MTLTFERCSQVALVVFIGLAGLFGCHPKGIVWQPDSRGIIFTTNEDSRLVFYNLARHSRETLVDDTGTKTPWPAISVDGERVAVARTQSSVENGSKVLTTRTEIVIYDLRGQELKRSRPLVTLTEVDKPATEAKRSLLGVGLNWSGPAEKILMQGEIYDCVRDEWTKLDVHVIPFNNMPIRPDGKGFLAATEKALVFVDWDGWVTEFAGDIPEKLDVLAFEWDDKIARFTTADGILELDTEGMRARFKTQAPRALHGDGKLVWIHCFRDRAVQICVFERKVGDTAQARVEVQIPNRMRRRTVLGEEELRNVGRFFFPSPDGKKVAFNITTTKNEDVIIVVNDSGAIEARIVY